MPIFDSATLARHVDAALADVPPDKRCALIAEVTVDGTVQFRFAKRVSTGWSVGAVVRRERGGPWEGGVRVVGTW